MISARKKHSAVALALKISLWPSTATLLIGWLALVGYNLDIERLYRPFEGGPATHPMTALVFISLGFACFTSKWGHLYYARSFTTLAIAVCILRLSDSYWGTAYFEYLTPFSQTLAHHEITGHNINMGANTAGTGLVLGIAMMLDSFRRYYLSQLLAFLSFVIILASFVGYAYHIENFYGNMSFLTALLAAGVGLSLCFKHANRGVVRILLLNNVAGKISRAQIFAAFIFCAFAAHIQFTMFNEKASSSLMLTINMFMFFFIFFLITVSSYFQEQADAKRRIMERHLMQLARTDSLTGLNNRFAFFESLGKFLKSQQHKTCPITVMIIDIDHFKCFNDQFDHDVGDKILVDIAKSIRKSLEPADLLCRYGGGEFAVAMYNVPIRDAVLRATAIRRNARLHSQTNLTEPMLPLTVSIGCAPLEASSPDTVKTMKNAYMALYRAKRAGRDCVAYCETLGKGAEEFYVYEDDNDLLDGMLSPNANRNYRSVS